MPKVAGSYAVRRRSKAKNAPFMLSIYPVSGLPSEVCRQWQRRSFSGLPPELAAFRNPTSKPVAENGVVALIEYLKRELPEEDGSTVSKTTIIRQIRAFLQSQGLLDTKTLDINVNELLDKLSLSLNGVSLKDNNPLFIEYLLNFWEWEKSDYIKNQLDGGFRLGKTSMDKNQSKIKNHAVPFFDPNLRLKNVSTGLLEDFKKYLRTKNKLNRKKDAAEKDDQPLATKTVSDILQAVTKPLREARRLGMIFVDPSEAMTKLAKRQKNRGILTSKEVEKLFDPATEWAKDRGEWASSEKGRLASKAASLTGLRAGEIGALTIDDLRIVRIPTAGKDIDREVGLIAVDHSWERVQKNIKGTKSGRSRIACVPTFLIEDLRALHEKNIHENGKFIFWG